MLLLLCVMWRMEHKPTRVSNFEDFPQTFDSSATFSHVLVHPPPLLCSVVVIVSWHLAMIREIIWAVHGEWGEGWAGRSGKLAVIYTEHCTRKIAKKKQKQHRERSKEFFSSWKQHLFSLMWSLYVQWADNGGCGANFYFIFQLI